MRSLLVAVALAGWMAVSAEGKPAADLTELEQVIAECERLKKECMRLQTEIINKATEDFKRAASEADKDRMLRARMEEARDEMRPIFKEVFRKLEPYGDKSEAVELLQWVALGSAGEDTGAAAGALLAEYHPLDPQILELSCFICGTIYPWVEQLLQSQLDHPELPYEMQWKLRVALVEHKRSVLRIAERLKFGDEPFEAQCRKSHGPARTAELKQLNSDTLELEILHLLDELVADYPTERVDSGFAMVQYAEGVEFDLRHLALGSIVPEIKGSDLDGATLRLADYEGKVVLLVFWVSSEQFVPQAANLNDLRAKYGELDLEIVGVCCDLSRAEARAFAEKHGIIWKSFADGPEGYEVTRQWNVTDWPTIFLIDRKGAIRAKNLSRNDIEGHVERLLKKRGGKE